MENFDQDQDLNSLVCLSSEGKRLLSLKGRYLTKVPDALFELNDLEVLDLTNNQLTTFPKAVENLHQLSTLLLSANTLEELPDNVCQLNSLKTLDVAYNNLKTIPEAISKLRQLTTLNLSFNELDEMPKPLCELKRLTTLNVRFNPIKRVPKEIVNLRELSTLVVADTMLRELPSFVCQLKGLSNLDVSNNGMSSLPANVSNPRHLSKINLGGNRLQELPQSIFLLKNLTTLDVSWNQLKKIPKNIASLQQLTTLRLEGNKLFELPEAIGNLELLTILDVSNNHLVSLPARAMSRLNRLKVLLLRYNMLYVLPNSIYRLKSLSTLDAGYNEISDLSNGIAELKGLTTLQLPGNALIELPEAVFQLRKLTTLDVSKNCLTTISGHIEDLAQLKTLNLAGNCLKELPTEIFRLRDLTTLGLSSNHLDKISDDIRDLDQLTSLELSENRLEDLPLAIFDLQMLLTLTLSSNQLRRINEEVKHLKALETLDLSGNRLEELPETICQLTTLTELDVSDNQINTLPLELLNLRNLVSFKVDQNPLSFPLLKVCQQGLPALLAYLHEIRKGNALHQKVVLLGSSGAGKTSLANTLVQNKPSCVKEEDRTIVLDRIPWEVDREETLMDVPMIDFGGDDIYKIVHPLFLDESSLVLLVVNLARYSDETYNRDMGSWTSVLKTRVPKARVILVGSHADCLQDAEEISIKVALLKDHFSLHSTGDQLKPEDLVIISSKNFKGISELRSRILNFVTENGKVVPSSWIDIYNGLQNPELIGYQSFLTFDTVKQLVDSRSKSFVEVFKSIFGSKDKQTKTILNFFHGIGVLLWYQHSDELKKFVFHRAEFLTEVMKAVFSGEVAAGSLTFRRRFKHFFSSDSFEEAKHDLLKCGIMSRTLLKALWKEHRIEEDVFDAMIDLFNHLDLCYPVEKEGHEDCFRFPWFLTDDVPEVSCVKKLMYEAPSLGNHRLSLKYVYPATCPAPLYHNFVVRLHRQIHDLKSRHDWKDGVFAHVRESQVLVHKSFRETESVITLSVEGLDLLELWSVILSCHQELTLLMNEWPGLRWECWIVCPHCIRASIENPGKFPKSNLEGSKCPKGHVTCDRHDEMVPACLVYPLRQGKCNIALHLLLQ